MGLGRNPCHSAKGRDVKSLGVLRWSTTMTEGLTASLGGPNSGSAPAPVATVG